MQKNIKPLGVLSLILMNTVIVGSLQMLPFTAVYGYSLIFFYLIATITFFIPSLLATAELATSWPMTGGPYIWVEHAFGKTIGFFTICILWFCNLIWYPTIFSLIATGFFYLIDPALANQKLAMFFAVTSIFWIMTLQNCFGIKVSSIVSNLCSVVGIILPTLLIISFAIFWVGSGKSSQIHLNKASLLPDFKHLGNIAFLTQVIISLCGIEASGVHAGDVLSPRRNYPRALFFSGFIILFVLIGTALGIALVIPSQDISLVSGLLDAIRIFANTFHLSWLLFILLLLITLGNFGCASSWMISSTRGMSIACQDEKRHPFLQKTNRYGAPVGILFVEAIVFTIATFAFWLMPSISASYWLLIETASLVSLVYYIILFSALVKLRYKHVKGAQGFLIPGGKLGVWVVSLLGGGTALLGIVVGFFPPEQAGVGSAFAYVVSLSVGMIIAFSVPFVILLIGKGASKNRKK
ncbi:MAG: APC family permease [Gammaproteobacteria bacterium]|nr:APC family permease [Gammaproteobacteria bacterium]